MTVRAQLRRRSRATEMHARRETAGAMGRNKSVQMMRPCSLPMRFEHGETTALKSMGRRLGSWEHLTSHDITEERISGPYEERYPNLHSFAARIWKTSAPWA